MRTLMGIEGDDVGALMKTLQLDVGLVHQYMDVAYSVRDAGYGEFWLNHCGALLDAEPFGEERVVGMCHTIEDPTFDATALAVNPRARIRPIHRPPRQPADRHPHCHWTITIDPANEPVGPAVLTQRVAELPLARVPNPTDEDAGAEEPTTDGRSDYRDDFDPAFRLADLSSTALDAVQEEFRVQTHLLAASGELSLAIRFGDAEARTMLAGGWIGAAWTTSTRLVQALGLGAASGPTGLATVLAHQSMVPPGFRRTIAVDGTTVRLALTSLVDGLLDPAHPGIPGCLARAETGGMAALVQAVDPRARLVEMGGDDTTVTTVFTVEPAAAPVEAPAEAALMESLASGWVFH